MIVKNKIELVARYYGLQTVTAVYKGTRLIWEAVNSCFGSGCWNKVKAWSNKDSWRSN